MDDNPDVESVLEVLQSARETLRNLQHQELVARTTGGLLATAAAAAAASAGGPHSALGGGAAPGNVVGTPAGVWGGAGVGPSVALTSMGSGPSTIGSASTISIISSVPQSSGGKLVAGAPGAAYGGAAAGGGGSGRGMNPADPRQVLLLARSGAEMEPQQLRAAIVALSSTLASAAAAAPPGGGSGLAAAAVSSRWQAQGSSALVPYKSSGMNSPRVGAAAVYGSAASELGFVDSSQASSSSMPLSSAVSSVGPGGLSGGTILGQNHTVLERWVSEQAQGALESIEASRKVLGLLRQDVALTRVVQRHSLSLLLRVNTISWALSKGHTTIVQGELQVS